MPRIVSLAALAALSIGALTGCSSSSHDGEVFLSIDAGGATYADGSLTLTELDHGVTFLTVEPEHQAWTGSAQDFADAFEGQGPLNAVVLLPSTGDAVALEVTSAEVAGPGLVLGVEPIADTTGGVLGHGEDSLVAPAVGDWGAVTVFVDPVTNIATPGVYVEDSACWVIMRQSALHSFGQFTMLRPAASDWDPTPVDGAELLNGISQQYSASECTDQSAQIRVEWSGGVSALIDIASSGITVTMTPGDAGATVPSYSIDNYIVTFGPSTS